MDLAARGKFGAIACVAVISVALAACDFGPVVAFTVTTTADGVDADPGDGVCEVTVGAGDCSLRAAVMESNATPSPSQNTITLGAGQTYSLSLVGVDDDAAAGDLDITRSVTIAGNGSTISGSNSRAIEHHAGVLHVDVATVTGWPGSFLVGGQEPGAGGAIQNHAEAILADVTLSGSADSGGVAVHQVSGTTILVRARITANAPNVYSGPWSAVESVQGQILIIDSEITDNLVTNWNQSTDYAGLRIGSGHARVLRSTIAGHFKGLSAIPVPPYVTTISGAGIDNDGTVDVIGSTVVDNGPDLGGSGTFNVSGSIIGLGAAAGSPRGTCTAPVVSQGYNLDTDGNCLGAGQPTDLHSTASVLGALGFHGGPTRTRVPLAGTVAVDSIPIGTPQLCDGWLSADQRGEPRPVGAGCDRGSVERQSDDP
jgi:CSLREA domain-containing protein